MRLSGKVAVVTGAGAVAPGWGNGRATSCLFAEHGATVYAVDRDLSAMDETLERAGEASTRIRTVEADLLSQTSVEHLLRNVLADAGRIDVLFNNVGGSVAGGVHELTEEQWTQQLDLNLTTAYRTMHYAIPHMRSGGGGSIINVASTSGIRWSGKAHAGYSAAKAAIIQLSRSTAVQNAPHGIRVNSLIPGQLQTPFIEARLKHRQSQKVPEASLEDRAMRIPLGFAGDGRDTAHAALFLASDESRFVTGTEIVLDGGMSARCN